MSTQKLYGYTNETNNNWVEKLAKTQKLSKSKILHNLITKAKKEGWKGHGEETNSSTGSSSSKKATPRNSKKAKVITGSRKSVGGKRTKVNGRKSRVNKSTK